MKRTALTASLIAMFVAGCGRNSDPEKTSSTRPARSVQVEVVPVSRSRVSKTLELVGIFLPARRTVIVAEVDGVIQNIPVPSVNPVVVEYAGRRESLPIGIGAEVGKGDLLIKLDGSDYERGLKAEEARLEQAQRELEMLKAWRRPEELRRLEALHQEAEANRERAESEFKRIVSLREQNAVSESDYDNAKADELRAHALAAQAKASLDIAKAGPTPQELAVAQAAVTAAEAEVEHQRWKVEKTSIVAPYDGVVTDRYVDVGDRVTALPRVEIMEIMDVRFVSAEVGVPEQYTEEVRLLEQAAVRVRGKASAVPGLIVRVNDKIDPGSRTFRIRVAVENAKRNYRVGQFVRVLLKLESAEDTLAIPRKAITHTGGRPQVFVVESGQVHLRPVEIGLEADKLVQIVSGVDEGEEVVVVDPSVLSDGMSVTVRQAESVAQLSRSGR